MGVYTKTLPSKFYSDRGSATPRLIILHTAEGARNVTSLGNWFCNPKAGVSAHAGIDDVDIAQYVPEKYSAWASRGANPVAIQAETCAFANWTPAQWAEHAGMIENTARWIADVATRWNIPIKRLRGAETVHGSGVCMHVDITNGWKVGNHQDCGAHFPIDAVIARAVEIVNASKIANANKVVTASRVVNASKEEQDMSPEQERMLRDVWVQMCGPEAGNGTFGWPQLGGKTLVDAIAEVRDLSQKTLTQLAGSVDFKGWAQLGGKTVVDFLAALKK